MRKSVQPEYYQATVTCNCGNTFVTGSTKESSKSAQSAILSILASRRLTKLVAVSRSSIRSTELTLNKSFQKAGVLKPRLSFVRGILWHSAE